VLSERGRGLERLVLVASAVPLAVLAVTNHSVFWPDEIFQSLEQAHRLAFGFGFVPWEFDDGARSWLFPGALGLLWRGAAALGLHSAHGLLALAKLAMVGCTVLATYFAMRLARQLAGHGAALLVGLLSSGFPLLLVFGFRAMSEVPSALLVTAAAWCVERGEAGPHTRSQLLLAGALAGLALFCRLQNALFLVGLLGLLLARRRSQDALLLCAAAGAVGLVGGLLDWATWGSLFHAFRRYVAYNLLEGQSNEYGVFPAHFYLTTLWSVLGAPLAVALASGIGATLVGRGRGLALVTGAYLVVHSLVPHKELRFVVPALPLLLALGAAGLVLLADRVSRRWRLRPPQRGAFAAAGVLLAAIGGCRASQLTQLEMGQHPAARPNVALSPWRVTADVNQLLLRAGAPDDLCGLALIGTSAIWTGGYSYLHRDVPFYAVAPETLVAGGRPWQQNAAGANFLIAHEDFRELLGAWQTVATQGKWLLLRRAGGCGPPPPYYTRVFPRG
jgi:hypothetical protein